VTRAALDAVAAAQVRVHRCPACGGGLEAHSATLACSACRRVYPHEDAIARFATGGTSAPGFDARYFELLARVEDEQFWFVSRRAVILDGLRRCVPDLASRPLYDVGCGPGGLLAYLAAEGVPIAGACDAYLEGLALARRRLDVPLALIDNDAPPPLAPGQKMIGMFDVLEHLDDDEGTLRWAAGVLEPGGVLVVTVPAHPFLFDEADVLAFHRRRYRRRELDERLRRAGFEVRRLTHFMAPLVPMLMLSRFVGRLLKGRSLATHRQTELGTVPVLNSVLGGVLAIERQALRVMRPPFGTSLLAIAARAKA
jgi:SAM-dependent methyltransferase